LSINREERLGIFFTFDRLPFFLFVSEVVEGNGVHRRFSKGDIELSSGAGERSAEIPPERGIVITYQSPRATE